MPKRWLLGCACMRHYQSGVMRDEGVTKYRCELEIAAPPEVDAIKDLMHCRDRLFAQGLIGVYPDGIGYGNVSLRIADSNRFYITGTQTGHKPTLTAADYCEVADYDIAQNRVRCRGKIAASSESMTHAAVYELDFGIGAVIHVHNRALWSAAMDQVPTTAAGVAYGTPEMAAEMRRLYAGTLPQERLLVMAGHEEGVIAFAPNLAEAEVVLNAALRTYCA